MNNDVRLPCSGPRRGHADFRTRGRPAGRAVPGGDRPRRLRHARVPQGQVPYPVHAGGRGRRDLRDQAGHLAERALGDRVQGRQRQRIHRQRRAAFPVRPGPDVGADRADLRRASALDHRLDDRRGDRHRAAEAGQRGAGWIEGRDGQDRADRGLAADPVDRRHGRRVHRRHGRAEQRRHPAPGQDRAGGGGPGVGGGAAGVGAQAGRVRQGNLRRAGAVQGRGGKGTGGGGPGGPAGAGERPACGDQRPGRAGPAAGPAAAAAAGLRGDQARRGRGRTGTDPGQGGRRAHPHPGRGRRVQQPRRARPATHQPAAADRQGGRGRAGRGQRERAQRRRRPQRDRRRPGQPGPDDPRFGPQGDARAEQEPAPPPGDRRTTALAAVYYLLGALAVTLWLWRDPASRTVAGNPNDADQIAWFFRYDATAVAHLRLPALVTTAMNAPQGVNAMWNTFMMLPGVLLAPVTLLFGPQSALTLFMTAGFAGSATAMFAVLKRWDVSGPAAALGGAVYGFSPAVLHSAIGHYDLQFAVLPPLIVHICLRLATGRTSAVRGGLWLGLLVTAQVFITEETLLATAMAVVIILAVLAVSRPRAVADKIARVAAGLGVAACVTAVIAGYPLWMQFFGPLPQHGSPFTPDFFKNDLSSFVVPSSYLLFHTSASAAAALRYQGHLPEYVGYLGWPLIIVLLLV